MCIRDSCLFDQLVVLAQGRDEGLDPRPLLVFSEVLTGEDLVEAGHDVVQQHHLGVMRLGRPYP